jgi:microsomal dipeptidase-like Zn-dependent dipeptidase
VAIGTDYSYHADDKFREWMRKGRWTRTTQYGAGSAAVPGGVAKPDWLKRPNTLGDLAGGLRDVGFQPDEVEKIMAGNWLRLYGKVFG